MLLSGGCAKQSRVGGPQSLKNRFRAKQQVWGVLHTPGATILLALDARPYLTTVSQGLFLPLPLLFDSDILSGHIHLPKQTLRC